MDASRSMAHTRVPAGADPEPNGGVQLHTHPETLSPDILARVQGRRALFLLAAYGQVPQETLIPIDGFERAGMKVVCASLDGGDVRVDPVCISLAWIEAFWNPTLRLLAQAERDGRLAALPSLRAMQAQSTLDEWLRGFDVVVVPGGHGQVFSDFIHDPLVLETVAGFHAGGRIVGLLCHGPLIAALPSRLGAGFVAGKTVVCWPRGVERLLGAIPVLGRYLMPFGRPVGTLLEDAGALVHDSSWPWRPTHVAIDGRLITGRGPWSARAFANAVIRALATVRAVADR